MGVDTNYHEMLRARRAEREALERLEWEWAGARLAGRERRAAAARARSARRWADDAHREAQATRVARFAVLSGGASGGGAGPGRPGDDRKTSA